MVNDLSKFSSRGNNYNLKPLGKDVEFGIIAKTKQQLREEYVNLGFRNHNIGVFVSAL